MRLPSSVQGLFFAPVIVCLFFVLKAFCPGSAGESCFADQFAVPIFLPLVAVYKIFGDSSIIAGQEFLFVMVYWAFIGFLVGLVVDLLFGRLGRAGMAAPALFPTPPAPKPQPVPASTPTITAPVPALAPSITPPKPAPVPPAAPIPPAPVSAPPLSLKDLPASAIPIIKTPALAKKPPINLLERPEFK